MYNNKKVNISRFYYVNFFYIIYLSLSRNRDKEIEELEDDYRQEMKLYHQKVKHLMYEQHVQLSETKVFLPSQSHALGRIIRNLSFVFGNAGLFTYE